METMQQIISAGAKIVDATDLSLDVSRLRASFPKAHLLIDRAEWGRFKDMNLAVLLSQLKDATYDAEDVLNDLDAAELLKKSQAKVVSWCTLQVKDLVYQQVIHVDMDFSLSGVTH